VLARPILLLSAGGNRTFVVFVAQALVEVVNPLLALFGVLLAQFRNPVAVVLLPLLLLVVHLLEAVFVVFPTPLLLKLVLFLFFFVLLLGLPDGLNCRLNVSIRDRVG